MWSGLNEDHARYWWNLQLFLMKQRKEATWNRAPSHKQHKMWMRVSPPSLPFRSLSTHRCFVLSWNPKACSYYEFTQVYDDFFFSPCNSLILHCERGRVVKCWEEAATFPFTSFAYDFKSALQQGHSFQPLSHEGSVQCAVCSLIPSLRWATCTPASSSVSNYLLHLQFSELCAVFVI